MDFNRLIGWLLRSPLHRLISGSTVVLGIKGVKSGRQYNIPVSFVEVQALQPRRLLVTSHRDRTWWRNLREKVEIQLTFHGKTGRASAQVMESIEDVAESFKLYFQVSPASARFFKIELGSEGRVKDEDLLRLARERVVIFVEPAF
ncbi:MAG: hypothetical protein E4G99_03440 [Anaerolineales bacterium]|nr:MAG: hypothetical protein E4G99_03440 [Anaerolineales bacterium]